MRSRDEGKQRTWERGEKNACENGTARRKNRGKDTGEKIKEPKQQGKRDVGKGRQRNR